MLHHSCHATCTIITVLEVLTRIHLIISIIPPVYNSLNDEHLQTYQSKPQKQKEP